MTASAIVMVFLALIIILFYFAFERSHPKASELVLVAQLCALAISARAIFSFVPYFNPVLAIIMLSGLALGSKKGFLIGSLTALGSNFIFGQGPWTLYQMVSWGLAGVIFGLLGAGKLLRLSNWRARAYVLASVSAALSIVFITGPIADLSGVFMFGVNDIKSFWALLAAGFVLNLSLAASTIVTFLVAARAILFALGRACRQEAA
jgi:uncharacterized membrane protein